MMMRHMLMLQFFVDASSLQIQQVLGQFSALARLIAGICLIVLGASMNPESLVKPFSYGVLVAFAEVPA